MPPAKCCWLRQASSTLSILDIGTNPLAPRIIASVMLPNEVAGPPVNLAITSDQTLAIMANSLNVVSDNDVLKQVRTYECTNVRMEPSLARQHSASYFST